MIQTPPVQYVTTYNYDLLGRLLKGTYPNAVYEYTYDGVGNRSTSKVNGATSTYTYNVDNQLTANDSTNYTYDNRGNQITAGTKTFSYNVENKLTQLVNSGTTTQNTYDGKNNRLTQQVGSVTTQFVNDVSGNMTKVLVAKNTSTNTSNFFVQGPEVISEGDAGTTSRKYYLTDGLGNIRFTTDSSGNKLQELYFDPYGNPVGSNGSGAFQFKGEQTDQAGLYFMRARYYDPLTGRFIARDPVEGRLIDPQTQNGYNYANANPVNLSDPSGEDVYNPSDQYVIAVTEAGDFKIVEPNKPYYGKQDGVIFQDGTIYKNNNDVDVNVYGNNHAAPASIGDGLWNAAGDILKIGNNEILNKPYKELSGYYSLNDGTTAGNWNPGSAVSYIQSKNTGTCFRY